MGRSVQNGGRRRKVERPDKPSHRTRLEMRSERGERARGKSVGEEEKSYFTEGTRPASTIGRTGARRVSKTADDSPRPRPPGASRKKLAEKARARRTQLARTEVGKPGSGRGAGKQGLSPASAAKPSRSRGATASSTAGRRESLNPKRGRVRR
ncbi:MAG: hypothetical protein AB2A00_09580 [Myxococcota bacterium]